MTSLNGCAIGKKQILILSDLHKHKMAATENETKVIILLKFASNWPFKETIAHRVVLYIVVTMSSYVSCTKSN